MRALGPRVPGASGYRWARGAASMPAAAGSALGLWSRTLSGGSADPKAVRGADDRGQGVPGQAVRVTAGCPSQAVALAAAGVPQVMETQTAAGMPRPTESREGMDTGAPTRCAGLCRECHYLCQLFSLLSPQSEMFTSGFRFLI